MQCNLCGTPVPQNAPKCNNCGQKTRCVLKGTHFPQFDQYGQSVVELPVNQHKKSVRKQYLDHLPEHVEIAQKKKEFERRSQKALLWILLSIPVFVIIIITMSFVLTI